MKLTGLVDCLHFNPFIRSTDQNLRKNRCCAVNPRGLTVYANDNDLQQVNILPIIHLRKSRLTGD